MNHTHGANKGLPCDPNPGERIVDKQVATSQVKGKVMNFLSKVLACWNSNN
jgi:hypothetical protein